MRQDFSTRKKSFQCLNMFQVHWQVVSTRWECMNCGWPPSTPGYVLYGFEEMAQWHAESNTSLSLQLKRWRSSNSLYMVFTHYRIVSPYHCDKGIEVSGRGRAKHNHLNSHGCVAGGLQRGHGGVRPLLPQPHAASPAGRAALLWSSAAPLIRLKQVQTLYTLSTYTMVMFMFPLQNPVYKLCPRPLLAAGPGVGDRPGDGRGHAAAGHSGAQLRTPITSRGYRGRCDARPDKMLQKCCEPRERSLAYLLSGIFCTKYGRLSPCI